MSCAAVVISKLSPNERELGRMVQQQDSMVVCWLRDCLRVHDNPPLVAATNLALKQHSRLLILSLRTDHNSAVRDAFQRECHSDLCASLQRMGNNLHVISAGAAAAELTWLGSMYNVTHIVYDRTCSSVASEEEGRVAAALPQAHRVPIWACTLYDMDALVHAAKRERRLPLAYNPFVRMLATLQPLRPLHTPPRLPPPPDPLRGDDCPSTSCQAWGDCGEDPTATLRQDRVVMAGGESEGLARLTEVIGNARSSSCM